MGLETSVVSPDDLVLTNPINTDVRSEGDDHIRLTKTALFHAWTSAKRTADMFKCRAKATPDMTLSIAAGAILSGVTLTEKGAQTVSTITAPVSDPRIDRIVVDRATGTYTRVGGVEAGSPSAPAIPAGKAPVAQIALVVSQTTIVAGDITDERVLAGFIQDFSGGIANVVEDTTPQSGGVWDTNDFAINESEGSDVASATSPDIWATDGNTVHLTGTTTVVDFEDAPRVGAWRKVVVDDVLILTHGSGITLPGGANITTAVGDIFFVYADAVDAFRVAYFKVDGTAVVVSTVTFSAASYEYQETSGTAGETYTASGWRTVNINTEVDDDDGIGALSSKQITLSAGTYLVNSSLIVAVDGTARPRLRNVTDNATLLQGVNESAGSSSPHMNLPINGSFSIAGSKAIELQVYTVGNSSAGPSVTTGEVEVYAQVVFTKIA